MSDLEPKRRAQIEHVLGRPLTDDELRPVASLDELSEAQRAVVRFIGPRSVTLSVVYVTGVATDIRMPEASRFIDDLQSEKTSFVKQPWSRKPGLGRWNFRIPPAEGEITTTTLQQCVATIVEHAPPFADVQTSPADQPPITLVLDLNVETEQGEQTLPSAASLTLSVDENEVRALLVLDVDIYAMVGWEFCKNTKLAESNAPRLARFLAMLRDELHAQLVSSDGLLPVNEVGFMTR